MKPNILWSAYFSVPDCSSNDLFFNNPTNGDWCNDIPDNIYLCPGGVPDLDDLDYDKSVEKVWCEKVLFI